MLWNYAVNTLIERLEPTTLIVYGGNEEDIFGLPVDVKFIPDFIQKRCKYDKPTHFGLKIVTCSVA